MMHRTARRLAASVGTALLLAACGGGGDSADPLGDTAPGSDGGTEISDPLPKADETVEDDPASGGAAENPGYGSGSQGIAEGEPNPNSPDEQAAECSAGDMMVTAVQPQGVSEEAARTWNEMRSLALSCDFDGLAELAQQGEFTYSFGGGDDPAEFWRNAEENGEPVMLYLIQLTGLNAVDQDGTFVWPAAHADPAADGVWDELEGIYPPDQLEQWREMESYLGHRIGITAEGDWTFFVAGD